MSQIFTKTFAKAQSSPQKSFAVFAYMEIGEGREQAAEALPLCESKHNNLFHVWSVWYFDFLGIKDKLMPFTA